MDTTSTPTTFKPDRLRHSLLSQGGAQVFKLLVSIGIGGWTARYLGPQKLGTLSYVTALVGLLSPLGSLGVKGSLSAMLCDARPLPGLLGSALLVELIGTLVIAMVLIPFAWAVRDPEVVVLIGLALMGNLFSSAEVFEVELLNCHQGTQLARLGTIQTVAGACLSVLALLVQAPLLVFGSLPLLQAAIRGLLLAIAVQAVTPLRLLKQASWETSRVLIQRGWPLVLAGLSVTLYMKSDQVMLEWLRGSADVGQYSVAVRVAECLNFLPMVLSSTFMPILGRGSGDFDTDPGLRQLYQISWLLGLGMASLTAFVLPLLTIIFFGDQYFEAIGALRLLAPCSFAVATGVASSAWLNSRGGRLLKIIPLRTAAAMILNICLNLWLIPRLGISGAALASSISYFFATYLVMLVFSDETRKNAIRLMAPF